MNARLVFGSLCMALVTASMSAEAYEPVVFPSAEQLPARVRETPEQRNPSKNSSYNLVLQLKGTYLGAGAAADWRIYDRLHLGADFQTFAAPGPFAYEMAAARLSYRFQAGPVVFAPIAGLGYLHPLKYDISEGPQVTRQDPVSPMAGAQLGLQLGWLFAGIEGQIASVGVTRSADNGARVFDERLTPMTAWLVLGARL